MKIDLKDNISSIRAKHEIKHSKILSQSDPELIWNWNTPAGRLRAKRRAEMITKGSGLGPGVCALEIGCGTGMFTEMFAKSGANLIAVDISLDLLKKAQARNLPPDRVLFLEKRIEDYDTDGSFDAVIGSSVLHHLDIEAALQKTYALLKPGGVLSFAEPNMLNPQVALQLRFRRCFDYMSPDETAFIRWKIEAMLAKAGFESIQVRLFDWLHPNTPAALIRMVKFAGRLFENTPCLRQFAGSLYIRAHRKG
jgi:2-polyprenyl-3-methyl-5-hydroxy-6-metoxy-1,4-benzoquinol methylase